MTEVGEGEAASGRVQNATVAFSGPRQGLVRLSASDELLRQLTADMLGVEPNDESAAEQAGSALAELTNILAGALVTELFGTATLCRLGVPARASRSSERTRCSITRVDMEGRTLAVELIWQGQLAS